MSTHFRFTTTTLAVLALAAIATACGDDATGAPADTTPVTTQPAGHDDHDDDHDVDAGHDDHDPSHQVVTIAGVDYRFDDVPGTVPAGSRLSFDNTSDTELHELVAFRLPDDVDAPLLELVGLPPDELEAMLGAPVTVMLQPPGAPEPIVAVGDGSLVEPGRYALMCFIPIGADPDEYLAAVAAAGGGKPTGVDGGPPHFTAGMFAELVVE